MSLFRRIGRLLLSWIFIQGGVDTLRKPAGRIALAGPSLQQLRQAVPSLTVSDANLIRANAVVQVVAGGALATGKLRRLSSLVLIGSLVPTTLAGHPYWRIEDPAARTAQRTHFNKNLGLIGGLLVSAGEPLIKPRPS